MKTPTRFTNIPKFIDENSVKADWNENNLYYFMTTYNRMCESFESIIKDMQGSHEDVEAYTNQYRLDRENLCDVMGHILGQDYIEEIIDEELQNERNVLLQKQDKLAEEIAQITKRLVELED